MKEVTLLFWCKILELAGSNCTEETNWHMCSGPLTRKTKTACGNLKLFSKCTNSHSKKQVSIKVVAQKGIIYVNDSLLPAVIIILHNNYEKFKWWNRELTLKCKLVMVIELSGVQFGLKSYT